MQEKIKTFDNQFLTVDKVGTGKKIAVLLHGIGGGSHFWKPFALRFGRDYTFVIPNLRGFGKSSDVTFSADNAGDVLTDYANDIDAIIKHYKGNAKVVICALSMGSYATMRYFELFGSKHVEKFLSIDQSPKAINSRVWHAGLCGRSQGQKMTQFNNLLPEFEKLLGTPFNKLESELKAQYLDAIGQFFESAFHRKPEKLVAQAVSKHAGAFFGVKNWESYYHCLIAYQKQDYDFRPVMRKLKIPVTLFVGRHSNMYPAEGQLYLAKKNPDHIKAVTFDEAHALMYTAPRQFIQHLGEFLK